MEVEMKIRGLMMDPVTNMPIVVLKDPDNKLNLPIWIGPLEAASMATELEGIHPQRPMTHDLMRNVLGDLGATVEAVEVTELRENTYFARILVRTIGYRTGIQDYYGSLRRAGSAGESTLFKLAF